MSSSNARIFVVTGANKGIGYATVKGLAEQVVNGIIYLTARNESLGQESLKKANEELGARKRSDIRYHQLDICDLESSKRFAAFLKEEHNGLDVLINNAGFAFKGSAPEPPEVQARVTIAINYTGTKQLCEILFPLIRSGGRVVNVCSSEGILAGRYSDEIIADLTKSSLTVKDIDRFTDNYIQACMNNNRRQKGFPESSYKVSKAAEIALSFIQSKELLSRNIVVNACHPGYVVTDMTSNTGHLTIEQGADTPIYLATRKENEPNGQLVYKRKVIDWNEPYNG